MRTIRFLILPAAAALLLSQQSGISERFRQLDRNGDGKLTAEEAGSPAWFKPADANGDGFVTLDEVKAYLARRTAAPPAASPSPVGATFDLCVPDVAAAAKFYRDGIGMREVEAAGGANGALLEWAGVGLRIRPARGGAAPPATGNPMQQMLASNGFRWFSLWFRDVAAVEERIAKAGYARPVRAANVSFTRDPDGNVVELMPVPRNASGETFTAGMTVQDEAASRRFYGEALGLKQFEPWNLPAPFSMKMYLFETGAGRIKFAAPAGQRGRDADAGPDAAGLRSLTLRVPDLAAARRELSKRGAKIEQAGAGRLLVADPDGNRIYIAAARAAPQTSRAQQLAQAPAPKPHVEEPAAPPRPGEPTLKKMPDGDAARDAAGRGQLFESIVVPGFTSLQEGTNGFALVDLNRDGRIDIVAANEPPRTLAAGRAGSRLRVWINEGGFRFREHAIQIAGPAATVSNPSPQVPVLADFNRDGFLDMLVTRHSPMISGRIRPGATPIGNTLLLSQGRWDSFQDVSEKMGIRNEKAYNRQASFGDANKDGWLDIAIGCDNIGDAQGGLPHSRLYVFQPKGKRFEDGAFADIGGTNLVPDFGGFYHDSARDKAGPDINLRDLDNDGDLELIQSYHVDCRQPLLPYSPGEYRQGVFVWRNMLAETGRFQYTKVTDNGLAEVGKLKYDREKQRYTPVEVGSGLPYLSFADVDNDGLLDVLAVGPSDSGWSPRAESVGGRFWRNRGGFRFERCTEAAGFGALNWSYREWYKFFDVAMLPFHRDWKPRQPGLMSQPGLPPVNPIDNRPYYADAVFGDFDNDGWVDVVVLDRRESANIEARAVLFLNRGDGTFEPKPTTFSGLDSNGIAGEAADLNNDGLLDLVIAADPDNTGLAASLERYESKVYWNTGLHGARANHWLRLRFGGATDAELIGARVTAHEPDTGKLIGMRVIAADHSYKSGSALEAHFGLGKRALVNIDVVLPNGRKVSFPGVAADRYVDMNLTSQTLKSL
jgi:catechol 2,3-dioxygenase-like lactoylglutathione lyase family enzyme